ncbi:MAG TPA: STAS domain-containing protein [Halalkalibaculum sp.]|nr:STAS domain-containing protein [Halalkalibaculum sp.]
MKYSINEQFNCVIIELKGNVMGGPDAEQFREDLHDLIEQDKTNVIVNLGKVKFINSSGLGIIIGALTTMRKAGGNLIICEADKKIENLLMITQLISVFQHYRTVKEAIEHYQIQQG